jgi:hypothetical protein
MKRYHWIVEKANLIYFFLSCGVEKRHWIDWVDRIVLFITLFLVFSKKRRKIMKVWLSVLSFFISKHDVMDLLKDPLDDDDFDPVQYINQRFPTGSF